MNLSLFPDKIEQAKAVDVGGDIILSDAAALLGSIGVGTAAVIVTDPPYGIAYHSNWHKDKNPHAPIAHDWNFQIGAFLRAADRALKDGGALYLFTRFDVYPLWVMELPPSLVLKNMIVWDKGNHSSGDLTGNFGFRHELIMFIVKGRHVLRGKRWPNIWPAPRVPHERLRMPAEKPLQLYERAISSSSDIGDLAVDPFCGSGTLAEAAQLSGRRFLAGDVDPKMVDMARRRVGLSAILHDGDQHAARQCPVFNVSPPDPSLWGLHPEDVMDWRYPPPPPVDRSKP